MLLRACAALLAAKLADVTNMLTDMTLSTTNAFKIVSLIAD